MVAVQLSKCQVSYAWLKRHFNASSSEVIHLLQYKIDVKLARDWIVKRLEFQVWFPNSQGKVAIKKRKQAGIKFCTGASCHTFWNGYYHDTSFILFILFFTSLYSSPRELIGSLLHEWWSDMVPQLSSDWMALGNNRISDIYCRKVRIHPNFTSQPVLCEKMFLWVAFSLQAKNVAHRHESPPPPPSLSLLPNDVKET